MKKTKLENQQQVWKGCKKTTGQTESMAHSENMVCRLSICTGDHGIYLCAQAGMRAGAGEMLRQQIRSLPGRGLLQHADCLSGLFMIWIIDYS